MSLLDRFAREPQEEPRTKTVGTKLTTEEYERFGEHCRQRGLSVSEGLRLLILAELGDIQTATRRPSNRPTRPRPGGSHWTIPEAYVVDQNYYMCPVCNQQQHRKNASRHAQSHGFSSAKEMFESATNTSL